MNLNRTCHLGSWRPKSLAMMLALALALALAGGAMADVPGRTPPRGTVPNPGT